MSLKQNKKREIPRVLTIYDIDVPIAEARQCIREKFRDNAHVKDERVIDMLVEKGYMDLEEALLQFKQRPHLLSMLQGDKKSYAEVVRKRPTNIDELFMRS